MLNLGVDLMLRSSDLLRLRVNLFHQLLVFHPCWLLSSSGRRWFSPKKSGETPKPELLHCRVCGHEMSTTAKACPHCGDRLSWTERLRSASADFQAERQKIKKSRIKKSEEEQWKDDGKDVDVTKMWKP